MEHTYCVIMAGGKGERFWPLSTEVVPKPFLKLLGNKTMIQHTVDRVRRIVPKERILIVIGKDHLDIARTQLPELPAQNFLVEPEGKDTAACIGFAAIWLHHIDPEAVMVTLPADHYIPDVDDFVRTIYKAVKFSTIGEHLITVGIKPTRPETGYGYIHAFEPFSISQDMVCYKVKQYVEKPDFERAYEYVEKGNYYWNGGIFVWRIRTVLNGIARHMPSLYDGLLRVQKALAANDTATINAIFGNFEKISIDYGLMEKADNVLMIPATFRWDDVGTWASLRRVLELDENGNYITGSPTTIDTRDCVIITDGMTVGTVGVSHLIIVASKEGILICDIDRAQQVREIARQISPER